MNKISPWTQFQKWLVDNNNIELPKDIYKVVNNRSALMMFCFLNETTIFLNNYFNKFEIMKFSQEELFSFLKKICSENNITREQFSFIKQEKKDKIIDKIQTKLPYLKKEEIKLFLEIIKGINDEDVILESLDLKKIEKKRLTKKQLKELNENLEKNCKQNKITTWTEWLKNFS